MSSNAPVLDNSSSPQFPAVLEGAADPVGITVDQLVVDGSITDPDGPAVEAIAITALDASLGTWQYSLDGGTNWLTIRADLINNSTNELALLLGPTAQIRLLPFGDLNGTLPSALTFRAWDRSTGNEGDYTVIGATGGSTAYSTNTAAASIEVTPVNDAPTFAPPNGTGKQLIPVGNRGDDAYGLALQPDGKIIVAGNSSNGSDYDFSLIRLNADGSLDKTFGDGTGRQIIPVAGTSEYGYSVALQPDGKIIVAGERYDGTDADFALIRLNANGSLDPTFGVGGEQIIAVSGNNDTIESVTLQPDGRIIVAGVTGGGNTSDYALSRLNADGSLDTTFGDGGTKLIEVGAWADIGRSVIVQPDGKIVVAGHSTGASDLDISLIRLDANGDLDPTFGDGTGRQIIPVAGRSEYGFSVALQPDGRIVVSAMSFTTIVRETLVVRLDTNGSLDPAFGGGTGKTFIPSIDGRSVTVQSDGKIVVAGYGVNGSHFDYSLVRLNANGTVDTSFGDGGSVRMPVGLDDLPHGVTVQPDGKIIAAGYSTSLYTGNDDFSLLRLNANGSLDTTFNKTAATTLGGTVTYVENALPIALDGSVAVYDPELAALDGGVGNYDGASVTLARGRRLGAGPVLGLGQPELQWQQRAALGHHHRHLHQRRRCALHRLQRQRHAGTRQRGAVKHRLRQQLRCPAALGADRLDFQRRPGRQHHGQHQDQHHRRQ